MPVQALQCKECDSDVPARRALRVRAAASGRSRWPTTTPASTPPRPSGKIQAGPQTIWRYADFLPFEARPQPGLPVGLTPLQRAPRLAERARRAGGLGQERHRQPDALVQGPRGGRGAGEGARARLRGRGVRLDRQPGQRGRRPRRRGRARVVRVHPVRPRGAEGARHGRLRHAPGGRARQLRRREPALHRALRRARLGVRERERAARTTREGSKTIAFEIAEQLGFELPDRIVAPIASGSLFTKIARGFEEWLEVGLLEGELPAFNGAQALGCSPVAQAFEAGHDVCRPVKPRHDRQVARDRQPGRRAVRARPGAALGRLDRLGDRRRDPRGHPAAGRDDRHLHRDRRRRDHRGAARSWPSAATSARTSGWCCVITGEGLKTLDAVRGTFETHEIEPSVELVRGAVAGAAVGAAVICAARWRSR